MTVVVVVRGTLEVVVAHVEDRGFTGEVRRRFVLFLCFVYVSSIFPSVWLLLCYHVCVCVVCNFPISFTMSPWHKFYIR